VSTSSENTNKEVPFLPGCHSSEKCPLEPHQDKLLSFATLGERWECHQKVAARRAKALGIPLLRINQRVVLVRLSDVLKAEEAATV
jgi:hypothetical protein